MNGTGGGHPKSATKLKHLQASTGPANFVCSKFYFASNEVAIVDSKLLTRQLCRASSLAEFAVKFVSSMCARKTVTYSQRSVGGIW